MNETTTTSVLTPTGQLHSALPLLGQINEGKQVELLHGTEWISADYRAIFKQLHEDRFDPNHWRVKPDAPVVTPWTFETAPSGAIKVRCKEGGEVGCLFSFPRHCILWRAYGERREMMYSDALKELEQLDGSCCGIQKEESEWPKWVSKHGDVWRCDSMQGPVTYYCLDDSPPQGVDSLAKSWGEIIRGGIEIPASEALALIASKGGRA